MARATLREASINRLAYRRDEAAASLAISPSTFDSWILRGLMPKGRRIGGVTLWDAENLRAAWVALSEVGEDPPADDGENPFDTQVA